MKHTRAYNAGRLVHNFFASIGHGVAVGAIGVKNVVVDFAVGVKDGGPKNHTEVQQHNSNTPAMG